MTRRDFALCAVGASALGIEAACNPPTQQTITSTISIITAGLSVLEGLLPMLGAANPGIDISQLGTYLEIARQAAGAFQSVATEIGASRPAMVKGRNIHTVISSVTVYIDPALPPPVIDKVIELKQSVESLQQIYSPFDDKHRMARDLAEPKLQVKLSYEEFQQLEEAKKRAAALVHSFGLRKQSLMEPSDTGR